MIALADCIARPEDEGELFPLVDHSVAVAKGCGRHDGDSEERLAFLAGLCHDLAKSDTKWQHYIRNVQTVKKGPSHAPLGSALFAYWADHLVREWAGDRARCKPLHDQALDWTRVVYDHHGRIDNVTDDTPWEARISDDELTDQLARCDAAGLDRFVQQYFPSAPTLAGFNAWLEPFQSTWERRQGRERTTLLHRTVSERAGVDVPLAAEGLRLAKFAARLVYADRSHAADWVPEVWPSERASVSIRRHAEVCAAEEIQARQKGASEAIIQARRDLQGKALAGYRAAPDATAYTLFLPTGYGKTLTGLRVALEAVSAGRCRRLIYVAPYISILSQSAGVIEHATGERVFVHHHLSILGGGVKGNGPDDRQAEDHQRFDLLDTWQTPILATTFNQLFRALFPTRAQGCLRIPALDGAFIFIDEPQLISPTEWAAFLRAVSVVATRCRAQVLFATATLPPTELGLGSVVPVALGGDGPVQGRYTIRSVTESWKADRVCKEVAGRLNDAGSVAVILNTVRDAVDVFHRVTLGGSTDWFFLAAMMLPGHKARVIARLKAWLDPRNAAARPAGVVCTQVLEAGVDLSFRSLLRATPVFSSVAQAAGRANRHGEGKPSEVIVFPFVRSDGKDSRQFVYKDTTFTNKTDEVLRQWPVIGEDQLPDILSEYYRRCWAENSRGQSLERFAASASGRWSELAGSEPFGDDYPRVEVFVTGADVYLPESLRKLMKDKFQVGSAEELLAGFEKGTLPTPEDKKERFLFRKQLSALLRQCCVAVPESVAVAISEVLRDKYGEPLWLRRLNEPTAYNAQTGFAQWLTAQDEQSGIVML